MRAGDGRDTHSVSPVDIAVGDVGAEAGDSEEEDLGVEVGESCERVRGEKEGAVVKKLGDPKLPSQEAVDMH